MSNTQKIGTHFNKENIFLGTICQKPAPNTVQDIFEQKGLKTQTFPDGMLDLFADAIDISEPDIFYKSNNGYTRYFVEGTETFAGDNSDGKGYIRNLVSIWKYFSEDDLGEAEINGEMMIIDLLGNKPDNPLIKYNNDYNRDNK